MSEEPFFNRITRERPEALIRELHILHEEEIASLQKAHEAAIAERDKRIAELQARIKVLEYALNEINQRAEAVFFDGKYDPYLTGATFNISRAALEARR